ncbi:hypothetical protein DFQ28_001810 [Apophysomyces sp. BC1034]|nr:hypothetical protein DFQ30_002409 [Apophysomyces sp. BC1015]KAG0180758.1 hypothetical protein DFQ29_010199 [Apophysomyces sp. BC1021]KAG0190603.1 hypothetical protein DFQ28_001810 [Apophysomyces sp. BC1034]
MFDADKLGKIPKRDREAIFGGLLALGGQYREDLTSDVTHLVCLTQEGEKYEKAIEVKHIKVVLPQWIDDCFKFRRMVREDIFQFPDPPLLHTAEQKAAEDTSKPVEEEKQQTGDSSSTENMNKMIYPYPKTMQLLPIIAEKETFLNNWCFYLSPDLEVSREFQNNLEKLLIKVGATVSEQYDDDVNIVVTKWRSSNIYLKACGEKKTVGSLWWVTNTLARRRFESPLRTLLDYPRPKGGIPGMENAVITITSYSGIARDYLRRLITAVGATYTSNMTESHTTHVICASKSSTKYRVARHWNLSVVNHLWIEECFQLWACKSVADERYVYFPGGKILDELVGQTPLMPDEVEKWWKDPHHVPKVSCPESLRVPMTNSNSTMPAETTKGKMPVDAPSIFSITSSSSQGTGSVTRKRPRQAAVAATTALQDVVVPDLNAYQKEIKTKRIKADDEHTGVNSLKSKDPDSSVHKDAKEGIHRGTKRSLSDPTNVSTTAKQKQTTIKIATSGIVLAGDQKAALRRLGAQLTESISQATHLVVEERVLRTPKFLCAVNLGLHIVQVDWIKESIRKERFQEVACYAVKDEETENRLDFDLAESLAAARDSRVEHAKTRHGTWLQNWEVCVLQSSKNVLKEVIETAGGKFVSKSYARRLCDLPSDNSETKLLIISDPKEKDEWSEFTSYGKSIHDIEIVIVGSFRQRLDLDQFKLR